MDLKVKTGSTPVKSYKKCPHCRNEYKYLKYDLFCPVCLRAIKSLIYETNQQTKRNKKGNKKSG